jgi:hypothetical protein
LSSWAKVTAFTFLVLLAIAFTAAIAANPDGPAEAYCAAGWRHNIESGFQLQTDTTSTSDEFVQAVLIVALVVALSIFLPGAVGAPWVPTSSGVVRRMLVMADIRPDEVLYDLGSGDGRIVIAAVKEFGAISVGVEIDPFRYLFSSIRIRLLGLGSRARIEGRSFYNVDLAKADVVTLYLVQGTNDKLKPKLERELRPTCRVVSHVFKFSGWKLLKADEKAAVYVYCPQPLGSDRQRQGG